MGWCLVSVIVLGLAGAFVILTLGLVALLRCNKDDIPSVVEWIGRWFTGH